MLHLHSLYRQSSQPHQTAQTRRGDTTARRRRQSSGHRYDVRQPTPSNAWPRLSRQATPAGTASTQLAEQHAPVKATGPSAAATGPRGRSSRRLEGSCNMLAPLAQSAVDLRQPASVPRRQTRPAPTWSARKRAAASLADAPAVSSSERAAAPAAEVRTRYSTASSASGRDHRATSNDTTTPSRVPSTTAAERRATLSDTAATSSALPSTTAGAVASPVDAEPGVSPAGQASRPGASATADAGQALSAQQMHAQLNAVEAQLRGAQSLLIRMAAQLAAAQSGAPPALASSGGVASEDALGGVATEQRGDAHRSAGQQSSGHDGSAHVPARGVSVREGARCGPEGPFDCALSDATASGSTPEPRDAGGSDAAPSSSGDGVAAAAASQSSTSSGADSWSDAHLRALLSQSDGSESFKFESAHSGDTSLPLSCRTFSSSDVCPPPRRSSSLSSRGSSPRRSAASSESGWVSVPASRDASDVSAGATQVIALRPRARRSPADGEALPALEGVAVPVAQTPHARRLASLVHRLSSAPESVSVAALPAVAATPAPFHNFLLRSVRLLLPAHLRTPPQGPPGASSASAERLPAGQLWAPRLSRTPPRDVAKPGCGHGPAATFHGHLVGAPSEVLGTAVAPAAAASPGSLVELVRELPGVDVEASVVHCVLDALQGRTTCCRMAAVWFPGSAAGSEADVVAVAS